jgi:HSP20 family protein
MSLLTRDREVEDVYREPYNELRWSFGHEATWRPPTDVFEIDDNGVVVMVEIAGLREGDFAIALSGRNLVISGERRDPAEKLAYQQMEIRYGRFRTQVLLPWAIDQAHTEAQYENGLLKVTLRKAQPRRITVTTSDDAASNVNDVESEG